MAELNPPSTAAPPIAPPQLALWAGGLFLATAAVFVRAVPHEFIELDDKAYVVLNAPIHAGPTPSVVAWALATPVAGNWHPVTVLSHSLDCWLFGLEPWGHHLTNVFWHAAAVALAFLVLAQATGRVFASAFAAAVWGWHPLRVESVAWVAERKDVLSMTLWLAAMALYTQRVRQPSTAARVAVAGCLALGLAAKPMLVTFPAAMVLWDVWPLGRLADCTTWRERLGRLGQLIAEKAELWLLVAVMCGITLVVQAQVGAVSGGLSLGFRLANALESAVLYLGHTLWPYPLWMPYLLADRAVSWAWALGATLVLVAVTGVLATQARRRPYLIFGWFWFLGTLVPVSGLIQAGYHSMADRFTYLPHWGLAVACVWFVADWAAGSPLKSRLAMIAGVVLVGLSAGLTVVQIGHWSDSYTLFSHALACDPENYAAHVAVGRELARRDQLEQALVHYEAATRRAPADAEAHFSLGEAHLRLGHFELAAAHFQAAIQGRPATGWAAANAYLANIYSLLGHRDAARRELQTALGREPSLAAQLGDLPARVDRPERMGELKFLLDNVLGRVPDDPRAAQRLARLLATAPQSELRDPPRALGLAHLAARATDNAQPYWLDTLAAAQAANGQFSAAVETARRARDLAREWQAREATWGEFATRVEEHLERYRTGRALREEPGSDPFWLAVPLE